MPISIPMLQRRNSSADLLDALQAANGGRAATFVPPHMVQRQEPTDLNGLISAPGGDLGLSPVAAAKREKLLARNAILRSTGFIEVQHPSTFGECRGRPQLLLDGGRWCRLCCGWKWGCHVRQADAWACMSRGMEQEHQCLSDLAQLALFAGCFWLHSMLHAPTPASRVAP